MKRKQIKLNQIEKGSLLFNLATVKINLTGFYYCTLKGEKVVITK